MNNIENRNSYQKKTLLQIFLLKRDKLQSKRLNLKKETISIKKMKQFI